MRNPERIPPVLWKLRALWEKNPDWRLGQLVENAARAAGSNGDVFYVEDEAVERGLAKLLQGPGDAPPG